MTSAKMIKIQHLNKVGLTSQTIEKSQAPLKRQVK
jgi:hypothetical protein